MLHHGYPHRLKCSPALKIELKPVKMPQAGRFFIRQTGPFPWQVHCSSDYILVQRRQGLYSDVEEVLPVGEHGTIYDDALHASVPLKS
jgi:hypothetical protein